MVKEDLSLTTWIRKSVLIEAEEILLDESFRSNTFTAYWIWSDYILSELNDDNNHSMRFLQVLFLF